MRSNTKKKKNKKIVERDRHSFSKIYGLIMPTLHKSLQPVNKHLIVKRAMASVRPHEDFLSPKYGNLAF